MSEGATDPFHLEPTGPGRYRAASLGDPAVHDVVFGGQMLAQMMLAAEAAHPGKRVKSVQTVFARAARVSQPLELVVDPMHDGRTVASDQITVAQGDRLCARALVLCHVDEPDLVRHQVPMPEVGPPGDAAARPGGPLVAPGTEMRVVGDVDTMDPAAPTGPAELFVWLRLPEVAGAPAGLPAAMLAYGTDGFLIGTAMRPHAGLGQHMAHTEVSTGVVTHSVVIHEPIEAGAWFLLAHHSPYAGRGRAFGRADVFAEDGRLVASFAQESLIRAVDPAAVAAGHRM